MSIESFTCLLVFKNIFSFALTFKGFDWIVQSKRIKNVFVAVGCVQIAVCCLSVPMCKFFFFSGAYLLVPIYGLKGLLWWMYSNVSADVFGKKNRSFFYRHNVFFKASDWVADRLTFW